MLAALKLTASPAARELMQAVELLRKLNHAGRRTVRGRLSSLAAPCSGR